MADASDELICRRGSVPGPVAGTRSVTIHLCGPPERFPATVATEGRTTRRLVLALLRMGFTEPARSPRLLVRSYRTVSPLPVAGKADPSAVCFLWHFPAGHPDWPLASILSWGAPTFLNDTDQSISPRSPEKLIRH